MRASFRFSTEDFPARDRLEAWREIVGRAILKVEVERIGDCPYYADLGLRALPGVAISRGVGTGMDFRRTPALIDSDDLMLDLSLRGGHWMQQRNREVALGPGEAVLVTAAEPFLVSLAGKDNFLVFRVPSRAIAPLIGDLDSIIGRPIRNDPEALRLLIHYAEFIDKSPAPENPEFRDVAATHICDLIALTLGASRDGAELARGRGLRAARLQAVKAAIIAKLGDADLSVGTVAARCGISPRYVQLLFEDESTTFSQFVLQERVLRAYRLLTGPLSCYRSVTAAAFEAGFNDLSYFNRTFRRRFGLTPSEARAARGPGNEGPGDGATR